jgi:hypothetical protein
MQDDSTSPNASASARNESGEFLERRDASSGNWETHDTGSRERSLESEASLNPGNLTNASFLPSDPHWTSRITTNDHCLSCGTPRAGDYCANCGQRFLQHRLALWELIKALFARVTDLESGLLHTAIAMLRRPGTVCREYVMGKQKIYSNPLTYYFLGAAAQILAYWTMDNVLRQNIIEQFELQSASIPNTARLEELLGRPLAEAYADSYISAMMQGYAYVGLFAFVLPFAVLLWFLHGALGERFRVGETFVFALFTFSQMLFLTALLGLVTFRLGNTPHLLMACSVYAILPQCSHTGFFNSTWPSRAMTFVATVLSIFCFLFGIMFVFLITFGTQVLLALQAAS